MAGLKMFFASADFTVVVCQLPKDMVMIICTYIQGLK